MFGAKARTAADLLVLFFGVEPHLRHRRNDPAMVAGLERLAFVSEALWARAHGRLSRAAFDSFLERKASGENLDTFGPSWTTQLRQTSHGATASSRSPPWPSLPLSSPRSPSRRRSISTGPGSPRWSTYRCLPMREYETRLDVAVKARTFTELAPATASLPPGW